MNGFLIFLSMVLSVAASGGYRYALPGVYAVGHEMIVQSDCACDYREIEPLENISHSTRQITPWEVGIKFHEQGFVSGFTAVCVHSIWENPVETYQADWMIR